MTNYEHTNLPLAGDILDDFAIIFRELFNKVYKLFIISIKKQFSDKTLLIYDEPV